MNFIKNIIASIKKFFINLHDTVRNATVSLAKDGFKKTSFNNTMIALVFWTLLVTVAWYGFVIAYSYLALNTLYGVLMYVLVRTIAHVGGLLLAMYMFGMLSPCDRAKAFV